jgi:8-oxo-dGTP pyrophosphatase MutT (NUDIX family)
MYKVFFNERIVLLTDDFITNFQLKNGLFYKYGNLVELEELLDFYRNLSHIDTLFVFHHDIEELRMMFRSCFQQIDAAGGLVHNEEGRYLIMKRRGKWDLPKGKLNRNESIEDAAVREVTEETGLQEIELLSPLLATYHTYMMDGRPILKRTSWFDMKYTGEDEPVPEYDEDITEIRWVKKENLNSISDNTFPAIIDVLKYANLL